MKFIVIFFFFNVSLFSSDLFYVSGEFSFFPQLVEQEKTDIWNPDNLEFYTSVLVGLQFYGFFTEAEMNTYMVKSQSFMFQPYTQEYLIRAGYKYKYFKIQYEHLCAHSVDGFGDNYGHDKISLLFDSREFQ